MKRRSALLTALLLVAVPACQSRQAGLKEEESATTFSTANQAATHALAVLPKLVDRTSARPMGFASPEEVSRATLGPPIRTFLVRLDSLRAYDSSRPAAGLLTPGGSVIYPVMIGAEVKTTIVIDQTERGWRATRYGGAELSRRLFRARQEKAPPSATVPDSSTISVSVPALSLEFLGVWQGGTLSLVSLQDDAALGLTLGQSMPANEMLGRLVAPARDFNGLPR